MKATMLVQPVDDLGVLVGPVVVEDEMELGLRISLGEQLEEVQELLMSVLPVAIPGDFAARDIQGSEEGGGAMPLVVVSPAFGLARPHRQQGLGAVEGLDLALLVDREHDRLLRRERVGAELEALAPMRLETVVAPDSMHRHVADPKLVGEGSGAPVGAAFGRLAQGHRDDVFNEAAVVSGFAAPTPSLLEAVDAGVHKSLSPLQYARLGAANFFGDHLVSTTVGGKQDDACSLHLALRQDPTAGPDFENLALSDTELERRCG